MKEILSQKKKKKETDSGADKAGQQVKELAIKPHYLSSMPTRR